MKDAEDLRVVIPMDVTTKTADSRGRINLGTDYADKSVKVAVLEVEEE